MLDSNTRHWRYKFPLFLFSEASMLAIIVKIAVAWFLNLCKACIASNTVLVYSTNRPDFLASLISEISFGYCSTYCFTRFLSFNAANLAVEGMNSLVSMFFVI